MNIADVLALREELKPKVNAPPLARVWGSVYATHTNGNPPTVDVFISGSSKVTTGIRYMLSYSPTVGDVVQIEVRGPADVLVTGERA